MLKYQPCTLNDNWFEERAPELRGVVADYGVRDFATQSAQDFQSAEVHRGTDGKAWRLQRTLAKSGTALRMTRPETFNAAAKERECAKIAAFKDTLPRPQKEAAPLTYATTVGDAYGRDPNQRSRTAAELHVLRQPDAPWVRGRAGARPENGLKASGAVGEVFKCAPDDPPNDTACQRSWLYQDPTAAYRDNVPKGQLHERTSIELPSERDRGQPYNPELARGRRSLITHAMDPLAPPRPGVRVFKDS